MEEITPLSTESDVTESVVLFYNDMINLLETTDKPIYIPIFYVTGTFEWFAIDKSKYLHYLKLITSPEQHRFPCFVEIESNGEIYIHPKRENPLPS